MADTKVYLSGGRIQGRSDDSIPATIPQTSWKELGRYTLTGAADDINVGSGTQSGSDGLGTGTFAAKDNLMILIHEIGSGSITGHLRFNGDDGSSGGTGGTGTRYSERISENGANDVPAVSQTKIRVDRGNAENFIVCQMRNNTSQEKLVIGHCVGVGSLGDDYAPERWESVGKWANTSSQITSIQLKNSSSGSFATGSEVVVLGCDNDEGTSGTNFWQELDGGDVDLSDGAATTLSTGTLLAKKYMLVQIYSERNTTGTHQPMVTFNNDAGANYAVRRATNGGSTGGGGESDEQGWGSQSKGIFSWRAGTRHYTNTYIINKASNEKLMFTHDIASTTAGSSTNDPFRSENLTKWDRVSGSGTGDASAQITNIKLSEQDGHTFDTKTSIRVWGSD